MNKLFLLFLSCIFIQSSVDAMEKPGDSPVEFVYTQHAQEQMEERGITKTQVEKTIELGQKYRDLKHPEPNCFVYKRPIKSLHSSIVVPIVKKQPNIIVIKTVILEGTLQKEFQRKEEKESRKRK